MIPRHLLEATPNRPVRVGRYDVTGLLGAGGMGAVFEAVSLDSGSRVALKTLLHLDPQSLLRFKNEFRAVADLAHPNLVSLYELGYQDDLWFFTMELIDGVSFAAWLRSSPVEAYEPPTRTALSEEDTDRTANVIAGSRWSAPSLPRSIPQIREALAQLIQGVRALHTAGLLHLDLKPSNVLVSREGRVVIVDFGLVRSLPKALAAAEDAHTTTLAGTPFWMAPEQYLGEKIGEPADWYAVGMMLYHALTGVHAFAPAELRGLMSAKLSTEPPPRPDHLLPALPEDLSKLAVNLLHPDPSKRPDGASLAAFVSEGGPGLFPERRSRRLLVGREAERGTLNEALRAVKDRRAALVHLSGPSGVGKSALLGSLLEEAKDQSGALILHGRCYEREDVPYKAFDSMLDRLSLHLEARMLQGAPVRFPAGIVELARVFPVLARIPAVATRLEGGNTGSITKIELRRRAVEALRELFTTLASQQPLVLGFDDFQWADADSAALLVKLLEEPMPGGLLIVVALRPQEAAASVAIAPYIEASRGLFGRADLHHSTIHVAPLPPQEAEQLAQTTLATLGVTNEHLPQAIAREAAGIPFFIEELAHHAATQRESAGENVLTQISLEHVLTWRIQSLSSEERALVEVLAVANSPLPRRVSFDVTGLERSGLPRAIWSLRAGQFVRSSSGDRVELHHDRMRESVLGTMSASRIDDLHLALGRALAEHEDKDGRGGGLFDAVRHLNSVPHLLGGELRLWAARLNLIAGRRARLAAAFQLALGCLQAGAMLLGPEGWSEHYELALALHGEAAEAAYLSASWGELNHHVEQVKHHGKTVLDQLIAWEAQIDAFIARNDYVAAVDTALEVLRMLGVKLPAMPTEAEVGAEIQRTTDALSRLRPEELATLPLATDPTVAAIMRIQSRIGSATYFGRPLLFPVLACRQVVLSVEQGLSSATPYALSVYGIVLNTLGLFKEAHAWGQIALRILDRFEDRSLEARTRHVVHDLVCTWIEPLSSTLDDLRAVVAIGKETGDLEYASYAAHAYVHNAFYASRPMEGLLEEALVFGAFMRGCKEVNALHVHIPFEQILRCFRGLTEEPGRLDGNGFEENKALAAASASGSRSAQCLLRLLMGIVRYHFGSAEDASLCLEVARSLQDGLPSTWHLPALHQYAALAIHELPDKQRAERLPQAEASLVFLRLLAAQGPSNFAHRVALLEAAQARAEGAFEQALQRLKEAAAGAEAGAWFNDLGLAHELAARCADACERPEEAALHREAARDAYSRWGAHAKVARLPR